jgi:hypothetical protein
LYGRGRDSGGRHPANAPGVRPRRAGAARGAAACGHERAGCPEPPSGVENGSDGAVWHGLDGDCEFAQCVGPARFTELRQGARHVDLPDGADGRQRPLSRCVARGGDRDQISGQPVAVDGERGCGDADHIALRARPRRE